MSKVLVIGAGGVGSVVAHKCAQRSDVFSQILLASRTLGRCEVVKQQIRQMHGRDIMVAELDAGDVKKTTALLRGFKPDVVVHAALPYEDLAIMDACVAAGVNYVDTSCHLAKDAVAPDQARQWAYGDRFQEAGIMALLGAGLAPGAINAFCAHAQKTLLDEITYIDIFDGDAGEHDHAFATRCNLEIDLRALTRRGRFWEEGTWHESEALDESMTFDFPAIGQRRAYLMDHEVQASLVQNLTGLRRVRFWRTVNERDLSHLRVLQGVGMTRIDPVAHQGQEIIPLEFLRALLPDSASLGPSFKGKTCTGCLIDGVKDGKRKQVFIYNTSDHEACYSAVRSHAAAHAAGVAAAVGAMTVAQGRWRRQGVFNLEQLDPAPFLEGLSQNGLPWHVEER